jgi:hypothetical protein
LNLSLRYFSRPRENLLNIRMIDPVNPYRTFY